MSEELNTNWRKVASSIYKKPTDSKIYGSVDIDVTELENFIVKKRREGVKTTLTHLLTLIVARAFREEVPELNAFVRRGKIIRRKSIDATVSVLLEGAEMGSVNIPNCDQLNVSELTDIIAAKIKDSRSGNENNTMQSKQMLSSIPWPFRSWLFYLYKKITIDWGISIPGMNLSSDSFGSFLISNIGTLGLDSGYAALLPSSNVSIVLIIGKVYKKPLVINDEIVIRKVLSLSATLDHRVVDGYHGGKLFRYIRRIIKQPELLNIKPEIL